MALACGDGEGPLGHERYVAGPGRGAVLTVKLVAARYVIEGVTLAKLCGYSHDLAVIWSTPSSVSSWYHFHKQRDAQQGMPQVKIAHLRALPAPDRRCIEGLAVLGQRLGGSNSGINDDERAELDALAFEGLGFTPEQAEFVNGWGRANPPPVGRGRLRGGGGQGRTASGEPTGEES